MKPCRRAIQALAVTFLLPGMLGLTSCQKAATSPEAQSSAGSGAQAKKYLLHGKIVEVDAKNGGLVINHQAIPGFMGAMTMEYKVKDPNVLTELHTGDHITATVLSSPSEDSILLDEIVITAQAQPDYKPTKQYHAPQAGDSVPNFRLLSQSNKTIDINQFRGKVLVVTFIYTRCPLSDYCPRMSRNFAEIDKALIADPKLRESTHLLSISFDPGYDTPAVLRSYGGAYTGQFTKEKFDHWDFAAPLPKDLDAVEEWFNVGVTPEKDGTLTHSLSTCVIGRDGKVLRWFPTNDWTPAQVLEVVKKAVES